MTGRQATDSRPGFVVLRENADGTWELLGEVARRPGLSARTARTRAILDITGGAANGDEVYAAVLRSEWRVALDWLPPNPPGQGSLGTGRR